MKCEGSPNPSPPRELEYKVFFCLCVSTRDELYNPKEWYIVNLSSNKDKEKEEKEKKGKLLLPIPPAELRGAYVAFHHDEHHREEDPPLLSPVLKLKKVKAFCSFGTCCAAVGSTIHCLGGDLGGVWKKPWSRKVRFFYASHPNDGWKKGPSTICGRSDTPVVAMNGKLYVFGGCHRDFSGIWGEVLDTTNGEWNPLPDPPSYLNPPGSLGFLHLVAVALTGDYSKKILVFSKFTKALCLYNMEDKVWESLDPIKYSGQFRSPPIVVGTTIFWINYQGIYAYDFVLKTLNSMPITDFKICWFLEGTKEHPNEMRPTLAHLVGDLFCLLWIDKDSSGLHCTKLRISKEVMAVFVLSCKKYVFDHQIRLLDCLPL